MAKTRLRRFSPVQRLFHVFLMLSFLTQSATGMARMYIETRWGKGVAWIFGGYDSCLTVHKYVGIFMVFGFLLHVIYVLSLIELKGFPANMFGPDSILPHPRDLKEFIGQIGWLLGLKKSPAIDRWGYWEKFDYWAVFWGMAIMGGTGLILAYPLVSTRVMQGWGLNIFFWIHREEATLAIVYVFIVHFFNAHLRPHSFPMDRAMFEGSVDLNSARHEKSAWVGRLEQSGRLEKYLVEETSKKWRIVFYLFGCAAVAFGIFLLIGGIVNSSRISF